MMPVFKRMTAGVLAILGEDSLLRGTVPCRVNIEHGVEVVGIDENAVVLRSIATIQTLYNPKVGDTLDHPDGVFKLDAIHADSGSSRRFIVIKRA